MKAIIAFVIWLIIITIGSLMPSDSLAIEGFIDYDKIIHVLFYLGMAFLLANIFKKKEKSILIISVMLSSGYGVFMEIMQGLMNTGRHFDYYDIIANIIGALIGALLFYKFNR